MKGRLIVIVGANSADDCKLEAILVYSSNNPRALINKSKASLPVTWKPNHKAWARASLFDDWFGHHFISEVNVVASLNKFHCVSDANGHRTRSSFYNFD